MTKVCTFFGHRDCPDSVVPKLRAALVELIEQHGVTHFYVGHQGRFDSLVRAQLEELCGIYPQICYEVVLAYMPGKQVQPMAHSILPEGIENVPPRFAIDWRNGWMLSHSDYVITYVCYGWGGAAKFAGKAIRAGKCVLPLAENTSEADENQLVDRKWKNCGNKNANFHSDIFRQCSHNVRNEPCVLATKCSETEKSSKKVKKI